MFTGIVETTGRLVSRKLLGDAGKLIIETELAKEMERGASLAVNGTCLSVEEIDPQRNLLQFHVLAQTLDRTNLGVVREGKKVNLERPLKLGDRLGGHLVSGHVDCTAPILDIGQKGDDWIVEIALPEEQKMLMIDKGSIAVDGISLTVAHLLKDSFRVHIIPLTLELTNLSEKEVGDLVNLEMDMVGKYVLRRELLQEENNQG
ncbi:MAG: riboflavin synthase [Lentisphaerae bacterium]|nr:MAG: riboflavin synthase [Lentisphaerota bacterium]